MDANQALADAENALRDFIEDVLAKSLGSDWVEGCGVTADRLNVWKERQAVEQRKNVAGVVEERLLYYADFYDLRTIMKKNWNGPFAEAFGEHRTFDALLEQLENLRNPVAHRRELLPHQKSLAEGLSGEIRGRMLRYRAKRDSVEDAFPRIESMRDSLGNISTRDGYLITKMSLRPGEVIDFVVTAKDPEDMPLEYGFRLGDDEYVWQRENTFSARIAERHISKIFLVRVQIRSGRKYLAHRTWDDAMEFSYSVLPPKDKSRG